MQKDVCFHGNLKMIKMSFILSVSVVFMTFVVMSDASAARPSECQIWEEVARTIMAEEFLNVTCWPSELCTGLTCSGFFLYNHDIFKSVEPFGFSFEFIPCSYPLLMRAIVNTTDLRFMKFIGVHGRNEEAVLLMMPGMVGLEEPFGRLRLAWNAVLRPVKYSVTMQVNFTRIYPEGEFPAVVLIPQRTFPVPDCRQFPAPPDSDISSKPVPEIPAENDCVDGNCRHMKTGHMVPPGGYLHFGNVLVISVGIGVALVIVLSISAATFICRRGRAHRATKFDVAAEDLNVNSDSEPDRPNSSRSSAEDTQKLLLKV